MTLTATLRPADTTPVPKHPRINGVTLIGTNTAQQWVAVPLEGLDRVVDAVAECVLVIDMAGAPVFANEAARRFLRWPRPENQAAAPTGAPWSPTALQRLMMLAMPMALTEGRWEGQLLLTRSGEDEPTAVVVVAHAAEREEDTRFSIVFGERGQSVAGIDPLTGLPTLRPFLAKVDDALRSASERAPVAVLVVGLDRLRQLAYTFGHEAINDMAFEVAARLRACVRHGDILARIDTDTFAVGCPSTDSPTADQIADRVSMALEEPHMVGEREIIVHASIGVADSAGAGSGAEELVLDADAARSEALRLGGARVERFVDILRTRMAERFAIEDGMVEALRRDHFVLHYQPEINLRTGDVVGFEALLRWEHPERGLLFPDSFIPLADENGMVVDIGRWVLAEACRQARAWAGSASQARPFIGVNVSPKQLAISSVVADFEAVLAETGADPHTVVLEITESVLVENPEPVLDRVGGLRDLGFRIAIDDFGSGYSSLGYIKQFPVDLLKIDRSLIEHIVTDQKDWAIVNGVLGMSHALGLKVIAEGIEDAEQAGALRILGCDIAQGWHFGKAQPAAVQETLLHGPAPWQLGPVMG